MERERAMFSSLKRLFIQPPAPPMPEPAPRSHKKDLCVAAVFVGAIALLLVVAGYVISRIASDNAYRKKWEEYEDYGWA